MAAEAAYEEALTHHEQSQNLKGRGLHAGFYDFWFVPTGRRRHCSLSKVLLVPYRK
jgi:hypothetical protein